MPCRTHNECGRWQARPSRGSAFDFPLLEDAGAIQIALMQVIRAIADNTIECKRAGLLLYALQTASFNLKRAKLEPDLRDIVLDTSSLAQEITPPLDPVEALRAMRRTYWTMRDPNLLKLDREIVARECAPAKHVASEPADAAAPPPLATKNPLANPVPRSPDRQITRSPDDLATDAKNDDPVIQFISRMARRRERPTSP